MNLDYCIDPKILTEITLYLILLFYKAILLPTNECKNATYVDERQTSVDPDQTPRSAIYTVC